MFISLNALFRSHEQCKRCRKKKKSFVSKPFHRVCLDTAYFAENWKYYSKIIFKCVNSTIRPSFKVFFLIKYLWVPWTVHGTHWKSKKTLFSSCTGPTVHVLKKKKKKKKGQNADAAFIINIQKDTKKGNRIFYLSKVVK